MSTFLEIIASVGAVLVLILAAVGVMAVVSLLNSPTGERRRINEQAREAEQQIAEIGRRAQAAILGEALRRVGESRQEASSPRADSDLSDSREYPHRGDH